MKTAASEAPLSDRAESVSVLSTASKSNADRLITLSTSAVAVCCSERFLEVACLRLHLVEQPHVVDGDDGLFGERLKKRDLSIGERARLEPDDRNRADRLAVAKHRHG